MHRLLPLERGSQRIRRGCVALGVAVVAALALSSTSRATLIAGDSYVVGGSGYTAGSLQNQPTGTPPASVGFTGAYTNFTSQFVVQTTGLTPTATGYTGAAGGSVQEIATSNNTIGTSTTPDSRVISRPLSSYTGAATYYFSALIQSAGALNASQGAYVEYSNHNPSTYNNPLGSSTTDRGFLLGLNGNGTTNSVVVQTASGTNNALVSHTLTSGVAPTQLNLLIVRLDVNASGTADNFTVYVNPTNVSTEALAATTAANVGSETFSADALTGQTDISRIGFEAFNNGASSPNVNMDEVRFGTAFGDVVSPAPEPSTGLLVLCSLACLGLRRRAH